jgi:hypothetical protein
VKKPLCFILAAAATAAVAPSSRAAVAPPIWAGQCGIPTAAPVWGDYGWPTLLSTFGHPGAVLAVTTGTVYPQQAHASGAATVYFDLHMGNRVGTPTAPADPGTIAERAQKEFDFAVRQTSCKTPVIVENELNGASTATPWTSTNAQYRSNVLSLLQHLTWLGAHPILLVNSTPFTGGDALGWWLEVSKLADIVREAYVPATQVWKAGPVLGSRMLRLRYRRGIADFTSIGIAPNRLGLMVSFAAARGAGGRNGLEPASAWFQVAKWQALAAKTVAADTGVGSIWSWGWAMWNATEQDPDKAKAACVWLWARSPGLCDAPAAIGPSFDSSLTEGQIALDPGTLCTVAGVGSITVSQLRSLQVLTGDRDAAMSALFERVVESGSADVSRQAVLAAEQTVIDVSFQGSRPAYLAALRQAHASLAIAEAVIADELRRATLERGLRARAPTATDVETFYASYPHLLVRLVQASPAPSWLGGTARGLAISEVAPSRLFTIPLGATTVLHTLEGSFTVKALDDAVPLGAVSLSRARTAITATLRGFARGQAFEQWTIARQQAALAKTTCLRDQLPQPGALDLVEYLPFLRVTG